VLLNELGYSFLVGLIGAGILGAIASLIILGLCRFDQAPPRECGKHILTGVVPCATCWLASIAFWFFAVLESGFIMMIFAPVAEAWAGYIFYSWREQPKTKHYRWPYSVYIGFIGLTSGIAAFYCSKIFALFNYEHGSFDFWAFLFTFLILLGVSAALGYVCARYWRHQLCPMLYRWSDRFEREVVRAKVIQAHEDNIMRKYVLDEHSRPRVRSWTQQLGTDCLQDSQLSSDSVALAALEVLWVERAPKPPYFMCDLKNMCARVLKLRQVRTPALELSVAETLDRIGLELFAHDDHGISKPEEAHRLVLQEYYDRGFGRSGVVLHYDWNRSLGGGA